MRIRRPIPEPDALLRIAAERDAALRARDAWKRVAQGNGSQSISSLEEEHGLVPATDEHVEELEREIRLESVTLSRSWGWWPVMKTVGIAASVATVFMAMFFTMAAWNTRETNERKALSQVQSDTSELHEYIRYLERDVDYIKTQLTKTSPDPCTEVSDDERMECLRLNTVMRIDKIRGAIKEEIYRVLQQQRQQQGQSNYSDTVVHSDRTQVDVRARTGDRRSRHPGGSGIE